MEVMMMDMKMKEMSSFIGNRMAEYEENFRSLRKDSREDEAVLCRVRINICGIYRNMLPVALKRVQASSLSIEEREQQFCREYLNLMKKITSNWHEGLLAAQKADDYTAIAIEETKLETAKQIEEEFKKVFGEFI
jgi:hypothetical protein